MTPFFEAIVDYILNRTYMPTAWFSLADVDGDGVIDISDVILKLIIAP